LGFLKGACGAGSVAVALVGVAAHQHEG
jgi:hypothetical protein